MSNSADKTDIPKQDMTSNTKKKSVLLRTNQHTTKLKILQSHTNLSLLSEIKKHDTPTAALQQLALATINERYPAEEYLRIYTDGSL